MTQDLTTGAAVGAALATALSGHMTPDAATRLLAATDPAAFIDVDGTVDTRKVNDYAAVLTGRAPTLSRPGPPSPGRESTNPLAVGRQLYRATHRPKDPA